ncbi:MAG: long-chain fatty acid--CoA ligase, partial [Lentimicrobium sp.]|nr:long-chain fatty acid--CoA ligase [Lentimicrobium sp.]
MTITRIFDLLPHYATSFKPKDDALAFKEDGVWKKYSISYYTQMADNITSGLIALGIKKGDKIATITNNRPEWNFLDMAIMQAGAIHVPVYPTISQADYQHIFCHAEVKLVFVAGEELVRRISEVV